MNLRRLWAVMLKEVRQLRRDRMTLGMILGIPVLQLVLFGYAINLNLRGLDAAVADQANTAGSRALVMDMLATGVVSPVADASTPQELMAMLERGEVSPGVAEDGPDHLGRGVESGLPDPSDRDDMEVLGDSPRTERRRRQQPESGSQLVEVLGRVDRGSPEHRSRDRAARQLRQREVHGGQRHGRREDPDPRRREREGRHDGRQREPAARDPVGARR